MTEHTTELVQALLDRADGLLARAVSLLDAEKAARRTAEARADQAEARVAELEAQVEHQAARLEKLASPAGRARVQAQAEGWRQVAAWVRKPPAALVIGGGIGLMLLLKALHLDVESLKPLLALLGLETP